MTRQIYPSDLTDAQWSHLAPLLPQPKATGRPRRHPLREILNAIFYVTKAGQTWRMMPHDLPPWKTAYHYFRQWRLDGTWERIHTALREAVRLKAGREAQPSACILDSQSVKTTGVGGPRGYDGGKKINGRKRHLLVDTQGLVLHAEVLPADIADRDGAKLLLEAIRGRFPRLKHLWVDSAYSGKFEQWVIATMHWSVEVVKHWWTGVKVVWVAPGQEPPVIPSGFHVLPRRWVVERTFAWFGGYRRLSKDYERSCQTSQAFIYVSMSHLMLRRLSR